MSPPDDADSLNKSSATSSSAPEQAGWHELLVPGAVPSLFQGGGEVGDLMRQLDWASTPLGEPHRWPQSLRTVVRVLLTSRFAMWLGWGEELAFLYNDAYGRMTLGRKHPWALGRPASEVWAEIWPDIGPRIERVMHSGIATWDEALLLFLERSGYPEETYHTFSYSPLTDDDGHVTGMLCVVSEETERVIGERRLASLRELASVLATTSREREVLSSVASSLGSNQRDLPFVLVYLFGNDAERARLVAASGIAAGHPAAPELLDVEDASVWPVGRVLETGAPVVIADLAERFDGLPSGAWDRPPSRATIVPIARQGQERPAGVLVAAVNPYRPFDQAYAGFVGLIAGQIASSLANARVYEEERLRAKALAELDRAKTMFFSNISHEFRTPLTLMLGPAEDALRDTRTSSENRERAALIHRNALRLLKLVNTMLDFSRIEAGRMRATYEPTDLAAFTSELASNFRSAIERAGLRLRVETPSHGTSLRQVFVDRDMWEKVVLNLMSNAFKHTFEGEIIVVLREDAGRAILEVRDTGVGIPAEQLPRIFDRFHRVPNTRSRTHEGTGIGLALVQELVRLHGGTIAADSDVGVGTTFTVAIPLGVAHLPAEHVRADPGEGHADATPAATAFVEEALRWLPDATPVAARAPAVGDEPHAARRGAARVLVADDNADMREYVARLLRARGWEVNVAADGEAALAAALEHPPALILSDVMMPRLDGFDLLRRLRTAERTRDIPVILLSARAGEEARVEGIEAGAADYLVKPFSARELLARVDAHLQRSLEAAEATRARRERELMLELSQIERTRLQALLEEAPAAIAILRGPEHVFESVNRRYADIVGGRELVGMPVREALPEVEGQGFFELLDRVYRTGEPVVGDGARMMLSAPGDEEAREHFFNFVYQPIREDGAVMGVFVHAVDVTDQVRARREAEAASRAKSEFLAAMSHELRTPLNAIAGYTQLLDMGVHGPVTDAQREALERVRRSQQHLLALINDVLNFAKLEAGRVEYDVVTVDLLEVVNGVRPIIEPQLDARALTFDVRLTSGLRALADRDKLQQILLNLLSNAVKFTGPGGRITIDSPIAAHVPGAERDDGVVYLRVTDTGIGIPREKQQLIFEPFVQVNRALTSPTEGTGLGLAISRDLARGMGGDLRVRSEDGQGAAFTVSLARPH